MAEESDAGTLALPTLDPAPRVLIVAAPYYRAIADDLIAGATAVLAGAGAGVEVIEVPGALEIPTAVRLAADGRGFEGYIAIGCIIRGETTHYETVCEESARGLTLLGVERGLAIGNAILTVENRAQAEVRAAPGGQDKGGGAAAACLHLVALARRFRGQPAPPAGDAAGKGAGASGRQGGILLADTGEGATRA
ncbi:MAG: 6,7-dimethyl-8-ribityllumazine synthase [Pseudomonadota bacterium]